MKVAYCLSLVVVLEFESLLSAVVKQEAGEGSILESCVLEESLPCALVASGRSDMQQGFFIIHTNSVVR